MSAPPPLVLGSASPRRRALLAQIGLTPDEVVPADIDESARPDELPRAYAERLAREKALTVAAQRPNALVLTADTVVAAGRRILDKPADATAARAHLALLSGRRHRVITAVALAEPAAPPRDARPAPPTLRTRRVETQVKLKRLSAQEIDAYLDSGEWRGKAGGYAIQGLAGAFAVSINGSYANVVGLPLVEVAGLLAGAGFPVTARWPDAPAA